MPAVFYILGIIAAAICANFTYGVLVSSSVVTTQVEAINFQLAHETGIGLALGSGIISAIFFSTGAIIETMRRHERDAE